MKTTVLMLWCVIVAAVLAPFVGVAQQAKAAHVGYVYPAGAQQGATVTVKLGGENVYGTTTALVSGAGVAVEEVDSRDPNEGMMDQKKKNRKKNEAAIDEIVTLKITVAADAEPGDRDICLVTTNMLSNKLIFRVGQLRECAEVEPNNKRKAATPLDALPAVVNGQIMPGDEDWFTFKAAKGQRLVVAVAARELLPYIADGVPGWFQAMVTLYDAGSNVVAEADSFRFNQDPVLFCDVPEDGEYAVSIRDTIYRGREDFGYRMSIGELPFITDIFPLGGAAGDPVAVRLAGVNLPCDSVVVEGKSGAVPFRHLVVTNKGLISNRVRLAQSELPEVVEPEPATEMKRARTVTLPVVINSRIRAPGEKHYYRFQGTKGQAVYLGVQARRLGSPLDSSLVLLDGAGRKIAANDDLKDGGEGFMTHHADSGMQCALPEDGSYILMIQDVQGHGGEAYAYRLSMGTPMPDFDLRMTPAAVLIPQGGAALVTLHVIRRNGFAGEIRLSPGNAPAGLVLDGARVPPGVDRIPMTVSAAEKVEGTFALRLLGEATVEGKPMTREAVPAENLMQAFLYQHLFPFQEETVVVTSPQVPFYVTPNLPVDGVLPLTRGKETNITVTAMRREGYPGSIRLQFADPPKGMSCRNAWVATNRETATVSLRVENSVATNLQGNLILTGTMQVEREATPEEKARMEAKAAREREAKAAVIGTNAPAGAVTTNAAPVVESKDGKPMMVNRPVTVTFAAIPFRVVEPPLPAKTKQEKADAPKPEQAAAKPAVKDKHAKRDKTTDARPKGTKL